MPFQVKCGNCGAILYENPNDMPEIEYLTRRNNQKADISRSGNSRCMVIEMFKKFAPIPPQLKSWGFLGGV